MCIQKCIFFLLPMALIWPDTALLPDLLHTVDTRGNASICRADWDARRKPLLAAAPSPGRLSPARGQVHDPLTILLPRTGWAVPGKGEQGSREGCSWFQAGTCPSPLVHHMPPGAWAYVEPRISEIQFTGSSSLKRHSSVFDSGDK